MNLIRNLALVSIVFLLASCSDEQNDAHAFEQAVARELLAPVDPDRQLAGKVEKALGVESTPLAYGVEVTAHDGRVELWGTVDSNVVRKRIEVTAAGVVGVKALTSHLQVDPGA